MTQEPVRNCLRFSCSRTAILYPLDLLVRSITRSLRYLPRAKSAAVDTLSVGKAHFSMTNTSKQLMVPNDKTAKGLPRHVMPCQQQRPGQRFRGRERALLDLRRGDVGRSKEAYYRAGFPV